jgi:hypothetical protein
LSLFPDDWQSYGKENCGCDKEYHQLLQGAQLEEISAYHRDHRASRKPDGYQLNSCDLHNDEDNDHYRPEQNIQGKSPFQKYL